MSFTVILRWCCLMFNFDDVMLLRSELSTVSGTSKYVSEAEARFASDFYLASVIVSKLILELPMSSGYVYLRRLPEEIRSKIVGILDTSNYSSDDGEFVGVSVDMLTETLICFRESDRVYVSNSVVHLSKEIYSVKDKIVRAAIRHIAELTYIDETVKCILDKYVADNGSLKFAYLTGDTVILNLICKCALMSGQTFNQYLDNVESQHNSFNQTKDFGFLVIPSELNDLYYTVNNSTDNVLNGIFVNAETMIKMMNTRLAEEIQYSSDCEPFYISKGDRHYYTNYVKRYNQ